MSILMSGIDHSRASLDIRSRFSFTASRTEQFYEQILAQPDVDGCILLSTCNRTEVWLSISGDREFDIVTFICLFAGVSEPENRRYFTIRRDTDAIDHLFRLSAGLESRILGEDQILTQIRQALAEARGRHGSDSILEVLFRQAVTAGKRTRTEAVLSYADQSVIHTALRRLSEQGFSVKGKTCMVIGNGMMGNLAAQTLRDQGARVCITVRKYHHKTVSIPEGCQTLDYTGRYTKVPECDMIVSATTSPHHTLEYQALEKLPLQKPLLLLDLAVPRDIEASVAELPGIVLYDIDAFQIDLESDSLKENLQIVERIVQEEESAFLDWYEGRDLARQILQIKRAAGQDVLGRMTPFLKKLPGDQEERNRLDQEISGATERMMNHLLYSLRGQVKEETFRSLMAAMDQILLPARPESGS